MMEPHYLSDEDEDRRARMSSPDTSSSDHGRGAALVKRPRTPEEDTALIAAVHHSARRVGR